MRALIDARPPGLDILFKPGDPYSFEYTFPAGYLDGKTFVATLDAASLAIDVTGDVLTVSATAAQTTAAAASASNSFRLAEVLAGDDITLVVGTWSGSNSPAARQRGTATVEIDDTTVTITPLATSSVGASNLIDEAVLEVDSANLAVNAFAGALVPNTIVTVPDVPYSTMLRGHGAMLHSVADSRCGLAIVPEGGLITARVDVGYADNGADATRPITAYPEALIAANSPGSYQLMLYSFTAGDMSIDASAAQKTWLRVFSA